MQDVVLMKRRAVLMLGSLNCYLRFDVDCNQQTLNLVTTFMPDAIPRISH